jgi:NTP pyrophosphatase (non-canonical NTP hydrolase)
MGQDEKIKISELKTHLQKFCEAREWDQFHNPKELAIGLITEASELLEHFRFQSEEQVKLMLKNPESRLKIADELADTFFFVLRFAQLHGFDLADAYFAKMERNEKKYPVEKARGSNKKYTDL